MDFDGKRATLKDVRALSPTVLGAVKNLHVTKKGFSITFHDPINALELLGKHLGMFQSKPAATGHVPFLILNMPEHAAKSG